MSTSSFANDRCFLAPHECGKDALVASTASIMGSVRLEADVSIWYGAVLRGDDESITIGARTNIQDNSVVHPLPGIPTRVGEDCTIGHNAIVHCKEIAPRCLIGMGAILLGESVIGEECIIAAGALVKEKAVIPRRSLVVGMPGRVVREVTDAEVKAILESSREYVEKAKKHRRANS
jgi:carbonic anhydrase/acetyltransferase-like protein (isoleucine patch superfamily)